MAAESGDIESTDDRTDELLFECLERASTEGHAALHAMCEEHPDRAAKLREGFDRLVSMGLLGFDPPTEPREFPDRLGRFQLIRKIGGGGMGVVYLAEQEGEPRRVALKVIRPDRVYYPKEVARFRREVEAVAKLRHPGIVSVISVGQDQEIPYLAMEWLEGATLYEVLRCFDGQRAEDLSGEDLWKAVRDLGSRESEREDCPKETEIPELFQGTWSQCCLRIAREIAEVLKYSHKRGTIHRDIKPSNIWITPMGRTVLIDFGLARPRDASQLTRTGAQLGSLLYMSPEQVAGGSGVDERTDIYSLGVTLYESLAFRSPFEGDSSEVTVQRIIHGDARSPRVWNPSIPRNSQTVCMKAMSRRVKDRYRSAGAFALDISNALAGRSIEAKRPGWAARTFHWTECHPARALGLLLLAFLVFFALFTAARERTALRRIQLLADSRWIEKLTIEARSFWPMDPDKQEDMDRWLGEVEEVRRQHKIHEQELVSLREKALPYTAEQERRDRAPDEERLVGLRSELSVLEQQLNIVEDREAFLELNGAEISELRDLVQDYSNSTVRLTWTFEERSDEWRHEMLSRLIETEYRGLVELELTVRAHQDQVGEIHRKSILEHGDAWARAIDEISTLPVYGGLDLLPQMGLRPLGRNPSTGLWEFLHVLSGNAPLSQPTEEYPGCFAIQDDSGIILVLLPGGVFKMGARPNDTKQSFSVSSAAVACERPMHEMRLDPFFISKYEMTVAQFGRLGGELAANQAPSMLPVCQARNVLQELLLKTWLTFPTEAQWEYGCRAGTETAFYTGDSIASIVGHANVADRSFNRLNPWQTYRFSDELDDGYGGLAPVGSFLPNGFGLYDVHGNIGEWTADIFVNRAYSTMVARDGDGLRYFARDWVEGLRFAIRGGSFWSSPPYVRSASRGSGAPDLRWQQPGVRPMRPITRE